MKMIRPQSSEQHPPCVRRGRRGYVTSGEPHPFDIALDEAFPILITGFRFAEVTSPRHAGEPIMPR
jgi:hypothetical protein